MTRPARYQGAILRDHHLLLIKHREHADGRAYWIIPGGGREDGETEEQTIVREMREETGLEVRVERLLLDEPGHLYGRDDGRLKTFVCTVVAGEPRPGYEPEPEAARHYGIVEVGWFDLRSEAAWGENVRGDPFTYPLLKRIQQALGYGDLL